MKEATFTPILAEQLEHWPLERLVPYHRNPRTHSADQVARIARSIRLFGFLNPILVDGADGIVAGHGRLLAARQLQMETVPVVVLEHLTPVQRRAYLLADNQLAALSDWDDPLLLEEIHELLELEVDLEDLGFDEEFLADLEKELLEEEVEPAAAPPAKPKEDLQQKWGTAAGQLWEAGQHRILCGDSTDPACFERLMAGARADLVFTDPPYGVSYEAPSGEFGVIAGDRKRDDDLIRNLLLPAFRNLVAVADDEAGFYIWHAVSTREDFLWATKAAGLVEHDTIVWVKPGATLGQQDYRRAYEPCLYAAKDGHRPTFHGGWRGTTVWRVDAGGAAGEAVSLGRGLLVLDGEGGRLWLAGKGPAGRRVRKVRIGPEGATVLQGDETCNAWEVGRDTGYRHPTQKPVELARRAIINSSRPGGIVLDCFLGSGATAVAAQLEARACYGIELDPVYCAVVLERLAELGAPPRLAEE